MSRMVENKDDHKDDQSDVRGRPPRKNGMSNGVAQFIRGLQNALVEEQRKHHGHHRHKEIKKERRPSVVQSLAKRSTPDPIIGTYQMISSHKYEDYLRKNGCGPLSLNMVMRARIQLIIGKDPDDRWRIGWETAIKAKSVTGYSTCTPKLTQNRFVEGEEKPELLDDWDQRLVVSCLARGCDGKNLTVTQLAEKDQKYHLDGTVTYEVDKLDQDLLVVTYLLFGAGEEHQVAATRTFRRIPGPRRRESIQPRRHSVV